FDLIAEAKESVGGGKGDAADPAAFQNFRSRRATILQYYSTNNKIPVAAKFLEDDVPIVGPSEGHSDESASSSSAPSGKSVK
ncbi:hypothetical protein ABTP95_21550, partial [Acinetobacter baumannii]